MAHDTLALRTSPLQQALDAGLLPPDHIILGDEAFSANSEQILTPVAGEQVPGSPEDTYNFFQSSLRMAIESESRARPNTLE